MRKLFLISFFLVSLVTPSIALAQTPTPLTVHQEKIATKENRVTLVRRARIRQYLVNMFTRLDAAVTRLERLIARMEARLQNFESTKNKDKTKVENDIAKAKKLLEATKEDIADAKTSAEGILEAESPKEAFEDLRTKVIAIKKDLVAVHKILVQAIGEMKGLKNAEKE